MIYLTDYERKQVETIVPILIEEFINKNVSEQVSINCLSICLMAYIKRLDKEFFDIEQFLKDFKDLYERRK